MQENKTIPPQNLPDLQSPEAPQQPRGRLFTLKVGFALFFVVIAGRLVQIQLIEGPKFQALAKRQYEQTVVLPAVRGNIFDRNNNVLASNSMFVSFAADPKVVGDNADDIARQFSAAFSKPKSFYMAKLQSVTSSGAPRRFVWLERRVRAEVAKRIESVQGAARAGKKTEGELLALYEKIRAALDKGAWANTVRLSDDERRMLKDLHLHTLKPLLLALNTTEGQHAPSLAARTAIMMDVKKEADMAELSEDDLKELGLKRTALDELIRAAYETLGLLTFFTSGPKETRAWTVTQGAKAPQAAGVIHSDFERGFIAAEVIHWNDLVTLGGETRAKEVGKMRLEGKEYVVQDGDVVHFRFSV